MTEHHIGIPAQPRIYEPGINEPGKCQVCEKFAILHRQFPETFPARFVEVCEDCGKLGDMDIAKHFPDWRRDGASV